MAKILRKYVDKTLQRRAKLWPNLTEDELWNRKDTAGFTTIPRTLSLVMTIIDDLTKGAPASQTYFELWCRAYDEMYVSLDNQETLAFCSGFTGQRAKRTWLDRMQALVDLGFIKVAEGTAGKFSHAVIINPHVAIQRLHNAGKAGLTHARYQALLERGEQIGATDMNENF